MNTAPDKSATPGHPNGAQPEHMLQICPHDTPPFADLCAAIAKAGVLAGMQVTTVILDQPSGEPCPGFIYLGRLSARQAGARLREHPEIPDEAEYWQLVLCHRYGAFRAARKLSVSHRRIVVLAHEFDFFASWRRRAYRFVFARRVRFGGVSPAVSMQMARHTRMGLVLPNIIDLQTLNENRLTRAAALNRLSLPAAELTVAVVGRLHYKKRPQLALAAFQEFARHNPQARLVFVGDGEDELKRELIEAGATVTGQIDRAAEVFAAFDVVLHTGKVDSFGMVVLEAMAAGLPVVASGGGPEYVLGELGCYPQADSAAAYAEALSHAVALQASESDLESYRLKALQRCEQMFSVPAMARMLPSLSHFVSEPDTDPFKPLA